MPRLEKHEQRAVADYLDRLRIPWFHCPNEMTIPAKNKITYLSHMKKQGLKSGVPDIIVLRGNNTYKGLVIELKIASGGTLTDNQKKWLKSFSKEGYFACCCAGFEAAKEVIDKYLANKTEKIDLEKFNKKIKIFKEV